MLGVAEVSLVSGGHEVVVDGTGHGLVLTVEQCEEVALGTTSTWTPSVRSSALVFIFGT
jgi:hypothetical protein